MQVTPVGRDTAKRFGVPYDWTRLVSDPVYNTQMGTAELAALLREYRGSPITAQRSTRATRTELWINAAPRDMGPSRKSAMFNQLHQELPQLFSGATELSRLG
jgi:hypothetical protein